MPDDVWEFREGQGEAYADWIMRHGSSFVLNLKTQTYAVLHENSCSHIAPDPGYRSVGQPKICAVRISLLRAWTRERAVSVDHCRSCME